MMILLDVVRVPSRNIALILHLILSEVEPRSGLRIPLQRCTRQSHAINHPPRVAGDGGSASRRYYSSRLGQCVSGSKRIVKIRWSTQGPRSSPEGQRHVVARRRPPLLGAITHGSAFSHAPYPLVTGLGSGGFSKLRKASPSFDQPCLSKARRRSHARSI